MKINEVEQLVGVTKKNIRFYETEGLLTPRRNSENGYRDYSEADVEALRKIKLLRKLGVPIEEIRKMQTGKLTVADAMHRHQVEIDRDVENLGKARTVCQQLTESGGTLEMLDAGGVLSRMEEMEKEGASFMNKQKNDVRRRYIAPIISAAVMAVLMIGVIWMIVWAFTVDPADAPPKPLLSLLVAIPSVVILGVGIALFQRLREIGKKEEDDATKRY